LDYTTTVPFVVYFSHSVIDTNGNDNKHLDPGETVNLVTYLRNFGVSATGVEAVLHTNDPYITLHDSISGYGDIASGDTANNEVDPYSVEASPISPTGHIADFSLIATSSGGYSDTSHFKLCIGRYNYLVWDPTPDQSSGPIVDATLKSLGYSGKYFQTLPLTELNSYVTIFISCGIFSSNYVIENGSPEAIALVNFLNNGGSMYLEGGDIWYYDPQYGGYDFAPFFGINATSDGNNDLSTVTGHGGTFTNGMNFNYNGENSWIDHISPTGTGFSIFSNSSPVFNCGVANDAGACRTVGVSFEFAGLTDGALSSTKEALADSIMHFFAKTGIKEEQTGGTNTPEIYELSQNYPNPFSKETIFNYSLPKPTKVKVDLYDISGRCVKKMVNEKQMQGYHTMRLNGRDLKPGIYFIRLHSNNISISRKCILVR